MTNLIKKSWVKGIIVSTLVIITFSKIFWGLGSAPLQRWDEQLNVDVVRTTLQSGNWLILKCKDKCSDCLPRTEAVAFLDKPPLWYWLTMCSVTLFGDNNTAYRLVGALCAFLLCMLVFRLGSVWFGFPAGTAALITILTSRHLFMTGDTHTTHSFRTADLDSLQLLLIMLSIYFFQRALHKIDFASRSLKTNTAFLSLALTASCLAYLAKGPMGFLPVIIFMLYLVINTTAVIMKDVLTSRSFSKKMALFLKNSCFAIAKTILLLMVLMTIVVAPWYLYQYTHMGLGFIDDHILYHLVRRASEPLEGHHGTWRFYFNIFFNMKLFFMGIPVCIGVFAILTGLCDRLTNKGNAHRTTMIWREDFRIFSIVAGFLIAFAVITAVQTKLMWYIFYVYPFAALLVGIVTNNLVTVYRNKCSI